MEKMQRAGVPASIVSQGQDLYDSSHLKAREFYRESNYYVAERDKMAAQWQEGTSIGWSIPVRLSETPMEFGRYSNIGEDNPYVFGQLLGMAPEEVDRLAAAEVLF